MPQVYGYARVSSRCQNLDRQLDALSRFGVPPANIYADKASGKSFNRPAYRELLGHLAAGDALAIASIDRLGRNYEEIIEQWRLLTKELRVGIAVLDMPLLDTRTRPEDLTSTLIADIVLQLLSYVAQIERESIRARQAEGINSARKRGVRFGRPCKPKPPEYREVRRRCLAGALTKKDAASLLDVSVNTFSRWLLEER